MTYTTDCCPTWWEVVLGLCRDLGIADDELYSDDLWATYLDLVRPGTPLVADTAYTVVDGLITIADASEDP